MSKELPEELYWLDFETTGLDPDRDWILECALYRATFLNPFEIECVIDTPVVFLGDIRDKVGYRLSAQDHQQRLPVSIDPFVVAMHTTNGLWEECRNGELPTFLELEELILQAVPLTPRGEHLPVLAGSSLGALDVPIMKSAMPRAAARFSHRVLDVSTIKLDCCSQGMPPLPKVEAHRAYADILESIAHLGKCREWQRSRHYRTGYDQGYDDMRNAIAAEGA